jgi:hypothetical protein
MLNVRRPDLERVLGLLPALQRPTVSPLSETRGLPSIRSSRSGRCAS